MTQPDTDTALLENVVKTSPGSPAFARLADIYRSLGQVDKAISVCENGIRANPAYPTGHLLLGRCYFEKERVDEALSEFETVLNLDWKNLFALKIMGDIHAQKGEREKAAKCYKKAFDIAPSNIAVRDIFRRFEKYYTENIVPADPAIISESPAAAIAKTIEEHQPPAPSVDFMDETPAEAIPVTETAVEDNSEIIDIGSSIISMDDPVSELPLQPEAPETTETVDLSNAAAESTHAPISRNIDDFNDDSPVIVPADTEMVDLPPEMTGREPDERVGDFKARKSVLDRILDEQSALLDALPETQDRVVESADSGMESGIETETVDLPSPLPASEPEKQGISSSAAGMDGYYTVDGSDSQNSSGLEMLDGLDNIELSGNINEDEHEDSVQAEAREATEIEEELFVPVEELPEVKTEAKLEEEPVQEVVSSEKSQIDPFADLMLDIDADDSVKEFLASSEKLAPADAKAAEKEEPRAEIVEESASEEIAHPVIEQTNKEVETEPVTVVNESGISSSAAGMDGYYNVSGSDAENGEIDILQDIDTVELGDSLSEEEPLTEVQHVKSSEEVVELGLDIELPAIPEIIISNVQNKPVESEDSLVMSESTGQTGSGEAISQDDINKIFARESEKPVEASGKQKKSEKKTGKKKTEKAEKPKKQSVKVVSNVATMSLADIYLRQGHKEQALTVYKKLLKQDPANEDLKERIQTIKIEIENDIENQQ